MVLTAPKSIVCKRALVFCAVLAVAAVSLLLLVQTWKQGEMLEVRLKRYGRMPEGTPVAWLTLSNSSGLRLQILTDHSQVPTAFCEYNQRTAVSKETWHSSGARSSTILQPSETMSIRVLLPTNGIPVKVSLFTSVSRESRLDRLLHPVRLFLYQKGVLSPVTKVDVPFALKSTNVVTKYVD